MSRAQSTRPSISEEPYGAFSQRVFGRGVSTRTPIRAQFEITYRCNIHCVHCYTDPFNTPRHLQCELALEEIVRIFDEMADAGVLWVTLTGGEVFVHPQFKQIYREAKARGFILSLFSNATTITDALVDFLAADPPFTVDVSLHGATKATFEKVTQVPGSYERCLEGIRKLVQRGLPVKIKTKAMTLNRHELHEIKALVEGLGLDFNLYTTIYPRLDGDVSSTRYRLPPHEVVELEMAHALRTEELAEACAPDDPASSAGPTLERPADDRLWRCGCGTNSITISPYGILRACTFTTWPAYDLKTMSLITAFERLVDEIQRARYTRETPCRTCPVFAWCEKNPAMARHEADSMEAPVEYFCDVAYGRAARLVRPQVSP